MTITFSTPDFVRHIHKESQEVAIDDLHEIVNILHSNQSGSLYISDRSVPGLFLVVRLSIVQNTIEVTFEKTIIHKGYSTSFELDDEGLERLRQVLNVAFK